MRSIGMNGATKQSLSSSNTIPQIIPPSSLEIILTWSRKVSEVCSQTVIERKLNHPHLQMCANFAHQSRHLLSEDCIAFQLSLICYSWCRWVFPFNQDRIENSSECKPCRNAVLQHRFSDISPHWWHREFISISDKIKQSKCINFRQSIVGRYLFKNSDESTSTIATLPTIRSTVFNFSLIASNFTNCPVDSFSHHWQGHQGFWQPLEKAFLPERRWDRQ